MKLKTATLRVTAALTIVMLLLVTLPVSPAYADDTGLLAPTANSGTGGGWENPGNAYVSDNNRASSNQINETVSYYGFNFTAIPSGATIDGIQVEVEGYTTGRQMNIDLSWNGGVNWTTGAGTGVRTTAFTGTEAVYLFGGATDKWGTAHTWVVGDFTGTNFRVRFTSQTGPGTTIYVDLLRVRVYYTKPGTTTTVNCTPNPVTFGESASCTATVTRLAGGNTPAGTVTWATDNNGAFTPASCTLAGSGGTASCAVSYTPGAVGGGTHVITATYGGNANFTGSSGSQTLAVAKATATVTLSNLNQTYDTTPKPVTVSTVPAGLTVEVTYDGSTVPPTNAGDYAVVATVIDDNYQGGANGTLQIAKADATCVINGYTGVYDGAFHGATGTCSGIGGEEAGTLDLGATFKDVPGGTAQWVFTGNSNYNDQSGQVDIVITPATPTLSVTNSPVVYNGLPQAAVVVGSVPGVVSNVKYNGEATEPTAAGVYAVTADFLPDDADNYNALTGASAGDFVIEKATPTLSVTNSPVVYNGLPQAAVVVGSVPGVVSNVKYNGEATEPMAAGAYAVTADFLPDDADNYNALTGASAGNFVIEKATPTLSVTNSPVVYNGLPQAAVVVGSVPGVVSNVKYNGEATEPTAAGAYAVTADFLPDDADNYNALTGASAGDFVILAAGPALTLQKTALPETYSAVGVVIDYAYKLTNTGNVPLTGPFTVADNKVSVICPTTTELAPGAFITCTASYTITQSDLDAGSVVNQAQGKGAFLGEDVLSNQASATVTAVQNPALTLAKTATPATFALPGQVIVYEYVLTNSGNVTLQGPFTVTDDKVAVVTCPNQASLAPAASLTCTANYTTTAGDVAAGSVTNSATAEGSFDGNPVGSNQAQATIRTFRLFLPVLFR